MLSPPHPALPPTLYKYRALPMDSSAASKRQREKVENLILRGELYFAKASQLNDPFEAAPRIWHRNEAKGGDYFKSFIERMSPHMSPSDRLVLLQRLRKRHEGKPFQMEDARILALSASATVPLLWAHYADNHTGVAVGVRTDGFLNCVRPVAYADQYPEYRMFENDDANLTSILYTKAKYWEYEKEWRIGIAGTPVALASLVRLGLQLHKGTKELWTGAMDLGPDLVTEVVLGLRASVETRNWVRGLVKGRKVRVRQAVSDPNCYGVTLRASRA
jgi:hypothetical protein